MVASVGALLFLLILWGAWVSRGEGEVQAAVRLTLMAFLAPLLFLLPLLLPKGIGVALGAILLGLVLMSALFVLLPFPGRNLLRLGQPEPGVDERDIMFSRATLVPGTERFEAYYEARPRNRDPDNRFRNEPGLLSPGSAHFHREGFAAADAAFWTIEMLRPFVEGEGAAQWGVEGEGSPALDLGPERGGEAHARAAGAKLGGERAGPAASDRDALDPASVTRFLKAWTLKMGAHSVGVTTLRDYHLYTHVGRGPDYGRPVDLDHPFALALTVEMDKEMVDPAPRSPTVMESALQYLRSGVMAVQLADLIRRLGYRARAHVDGNYRVICPLVARDAGLGELGRMGLLMTPRLGPRVRIAVVTTDIPLITDEPAQELTTVDFCLHCRKCADSCPSRAIAFGDPEMDDNGVLRWKIDAEACFTLWGRLGTDCARCMAVCPFSHPDHALHSLVRWGIRHNGLFRRGAVWMDDLVYGRRPPPRDLPVWMDISESNPRRARTDLREPTEKGGAGDR
jgi:ferredoxin